MPADTTPKYLQLANEMEAAIRTGKLTGGLKLPSVRELMKQRQLSLATVVNAYRTLEERQLIEAQNKSGFFVRRPAAAKPPRDGNRSDNQPPPMMAAPAEDLLPGKKLQRMLATTLRRHPYCTSRRTEALGLPALRAELGKRAAEHGLFVKNDEITVCNGATEALQLALRAACKVGDAVLLQQPACPLFLHVLREHGLRPVLITADSRQPDFFHALREQLASQPVQAALLIANFHHPTGELWSIRDKREWLRLAESEGFCLIENDVYGDMQFQGPRPPAIKSFDLNGQVIYLTSFSKTAAPGLNLGWIAGGKWRERIQHLKTQAMPATPALAQLAMLDYLSQGSHLPQLRRLRRVLAERSAAFEQLLKPVRQKGWHWQAPAGGLFLWLELPAGVDASQVLQQHPALAAHCLPGEYFSADDRFRHCLRVNISAELDAGAKQAWRTVASAI